jgi:2'-5' RNA ligase
LETVRSFIAFDIENQNILRNLSNVQDMLMETGADLRTVKPENIHITLRFLGNIPVELVDEIHIAMEKTDFTSFNIELKGLGIFPNPNRIRVIWAGINKGASELDDIFCQLEPRLRTLGLKPDRKGFSPHLTIARVKTGRNKAQLARRVIDLRYYEFGLITANCLRLKRSVLTPKGPIYSVLRETLCNN